MGTQGTTTLSDLMIQSAAYVDEFLGHNDGVNAIIAHEKSIFSASSDRRVVQWSATVQTLLVRVDASDVRSRA